MNYYEILGVDSNATQDDIKKAYRQKAIKHHPDKGGDAEQFKKIAEAYENLSDPAKKQAYDNPNQGFNGNFGGFNMEDIFGGGFGGFGDFFQNRSNGRQQSQPISASITLDISDVLNGCKRTIKYKRDVACTGCDGNGGTDVITCATCKGQGQVLRTVQSFMGMAQTVQTCVACNGSGKSVKHKCTKCNARGVETVDATIDIDVPKGVNESHRFNITGNGSYIKNRGYSDLEVQININYNGYTRHNNTVDISKGINISVIDALLGSKIKVKTLEKDILVDVPIGTVNNNKIKIKGHGLPSFENPSKRGDLWLEVSIITPKQISETEKELLLKLKAETNFNI